MERDKLSVTQWHGAKLVLPPQHRNQVRRVAGKAHAGRGRVNQPAPADAESAQPENYVWGKVVPDTLNVLRLVGPRHRNSRLLPQPGQFVGRGVFQPVDYMGRMAPA